MGSPFEVSCACAYSMILSASPMGSIEVFSLVPVVEYRIVPHAAGETSLIHLAVELVLIEGSPSPMSSHSTVLKASLRTVLVSPSSYFSSTNLYVEIALSLILAQHISKISRGKR